MLTHVERSLRDSIPQPRFERHRHRLLACSCLGMYADVACPTRDMHNCFSGAFQKKRQKRSQHNDAANRVDPEDGLNGA